MPNTGLLIQQRNRQIFNALDYANGARPDGATDMSSALLAAALAASQNGQTSAPNAPGLTNDALSSSSFTAGQIVQVAYTWVTAHGETGLSATASLTTPANGNDVIVTIPAFPTGVIGANIYAGIANNAAPTYKVTSGNTTTVSAAGNYTLTNFAVNTNLPAPTINTTGGGKVWLNAGVWQTSQSLPLYSNIIYESEGYEACVVRLMTGANVDVFRSYNFAALTTTGSLDGARQFGIKNLTIDGNNGGNSAGAGISNYGYGYTLDGVRVRNCAGAGIYSEWALSSSSPGYDSMEATIINFKIHNCKGNGLDFYGPHDSTICNGVIYSNGPGGVNTNSNLHMGLTANSNVAGTQILLVHCWGVNANWAFQLDDYCKMVGCVAEGGNTGQVNIRANSVQMDDCYAFAGAGVTNTKGIVLGDGTHTNIVNCKIRADVRSVDLGALDVTNAGAYNDIEIHSSAATTPSGIVGSVNAGSRVIFYEHSDVGSSTSSTQQLIGNLKLRPTSTGVDAFNVLTQAGGNGFNVGQAGNAAFGTSVNTGFQTLVRNNADNSIGLALIGNSATQSSDLFQIQNSSFAVMAAFDKVGRLYSRAATAPTGSMQSGAGTSPPAAVITTNSSDNRGGCTFGTGTTPTTGNQININYWKGWPNSIPAFVVIIPSNAATAALQPYISAMSTTLFTVAFGVAPAASQSNTTYGFTWIAIG